MGGLSGTENGSGKHSKELDGPEQQTKRGTKKAVKAHGDMMLNLIMPVAWSAWILQGISADR